MKSVSVFAFFAWMLLAIPNASAQAPAPPAPPRVGIAPGAPATLALRDAVDLALASNNDVAIARLERDAAGQDVTAALGAYDVRFAPLFTYDRIQSPIASVIGGAANNALQTNSVSVNLQATGLSPWFGGRFTADFASTRVESTNQNLQLNPQFPASFALGYVQPLSRGLTIDAERRQVLLSRLATDLTDAQLTRVLMDQLSLVEQAYWELVFARRNVEVQTTALGQARAQAASNERQAQQGTLALIDVVEAETQVATFQQSLATAEQALTSAENSVKSLILRDHNAALWNVALEPSDVTGRLIPAIALDDAIRLALSRRPELSELAAARAQNDVDRRYFSDQKRPRIDLAAGYSLAGLAGTIAGQPGTGVGRTDPAVLARLNDLSLRAGLGPLEPASTPAGPINSILVGGYSDSLANLWSRRFPSVSVQVQMELPLRNRTAQAQAARTRIVEQQFERDHDRLQQLITAEVRNALQAVQSSSQRLNAASAAHRNAQEQYESERRRFDAGMSTVFLVLERQTALVSAQAQELRARADLNIAIAVFDRAVGGTLDQHGVQLESE